MPLPPLPSIPNIGRGGVGYALQDLTLSGDLITDAERALGQAADVADFLPIPGGVNVWAAYTNKVTQSVPGAAADTNVTVGGDVGAVLSKVVDPLAPVANASGEVWEFDNSAGALDATVEFDGATGATTAHSISISAKAIAGIPTLMLGTLGVGSTPVNITAMEWPGEAGADNRTKSANITPLSTDVIRITVPAGAVVRFVAPQLQTGSIVTPWRRTDGSSESATAGRAQQPVSDLFTSTQGALLVRMAIPWASASTPLALPSPFSWYSNSSNHLRCYWNSGAPNKWEFDRRGAAASGTAKVTDSWAAGASVTVAMAWTAALTRLSVDGAAFVEQANTFIPNLSAVTTFDLMSNPGEAVTRIMDARLLWAATFSGTLTDADAAALDAFGDTPPTPAQLRAILGPNARPTSLWECIDGTFKRIW